MFKSSTTATGPEEVNRGATGSAGGTGVVEIGVRGVRGEDDTDFYIAATEQYSAIAGIVNAAHGQLVDLTVLTLEEGHHVGPGLYTAGQYVAWQTGVSKTTANRICRLAKRHQELPETLSLLRSGQISLEQADVIAQLCPSEYEQSASEVALSASVNQLRTIVGCYSNKKDPKPPPPKTVSISRDDHGATVRARLDHTEADLFEKALQTTRDNLFSQYNKSTESAQGGAEDTKVAPLKKPSRTDALAAMCETVLQAGQTAHANPDRYLINYHLHATRDGQLCLTNQYGQQLPEPERLRLLCDHAFETVLHHQDGEPLSVGRKTRSIGAKLRRAILFRDKHQCTVPGCDTTVGLEIHHIVHWEHGGSTNPENLLSLCGPHHRLHHQGLLNITKNPLTFSTPSGFAFQPTNPPTPPSKTNRAPSITKLRNKLQARSRTKPRFQHPIPVAFTPSGEKLDRWGIHLNASTPPANNGPSSPTPMRT